MKKFFLLSLVIFNSISAEAAQTKKVALLMKAKNNAFYDLVLQGAREKASQFGYEVTPFYGADEDDWQSQVDILNSKALDFDAFLLIPNRSDKFASTLTHLKKSGKAVAIVDTPLIEGSESVLTTISSNNYAGGRLAGHFMVNAIAVEPAAEKCIVLFSGNTNAKTHQDRNQGFLDAFKTKRPDIKIYTYEAFSSFDKAKEVTEKNIAQIQKCYGVFAGSDTMALGMLNVFESRNLREPPVTVGYDSILEVQRKILESKITASVEQSPAEMGRAAVTAINNFFQNKPVEAIQIIEPRLTVRKFRVDSITERDLDNLAPKAER